MQDEKALQLFYKILQKTRSKALSWEAGAEDDQYIVSLGPELILKLWPYTDPDLSGPPSVTLYDNKDNMLLDMNYRVDGIAKSDLQELSTVAKRIALNIDKTVDKALARLDELVDEDA